MHKPGGDGDGPAGAVPSAGTGPRERAVCRVLRHEVGQLYRPATGKHLELPAGQL